MFKTCKNLQTVYFGSNHINALDPGIFKSCSNLTEIYFSANRFKELHQDIFKQCLNLKHIDFSFNEISELPLDIFYESNLAVIDMRSNQIKEIHKDIFKHCEYLQTIYFGSNQIEKLDESTFQNCLKLSNFFFDFNKIKELQPKTFANCKILTSINLESNEIKKLDKDTFMQCKKIQNLYFSSNKITDLSSNLFKNCPELHHVYFNSNQIKHLDFDLIKDFPTHCDFFLSNNFIQRLSILDQTDKHRLIDLRNNIKTLDIQTFYTSFSLDYEDFGLSCGSISAFLKLDNSLFQANQEKQKSKIYLFRRSDLKFIKEFFFLLLFNKTPYDLSLDVFMQVRNEFDFNFEMFKTLKWSILDFLIINIENLGSDNLINLNTYINYELKQNPNNLVNLDFKMRSGDSVKSFCKFNDISLFNVFFEHDLNIKDLKNDKESNQSRIYDHKTFYTTINF